MNIATTIVAFYIPVTTMCVLYFQVCTIHILWLTILGLSRNCPTDKNAAICKQSARWIGAHVFWQAQSWRVWAPS